MQTTAEVIQLAPAPVFLLVAIGQLLNAVTSRLARVIDRSRLLTEHLHTGTSYRADHDLREELGGLDRRIRFANLAANFLTTAAVAVCIVVILLFMDGLSEFDLQGVVAVLFMLTMVLITGGVISFLVEVSIATATLRVRIGRPPD